MERFSQVSTAKFYGALIVAATPLIVMTALLVGAFVMALNR